MSQPLTVRLTDPAVEELRGIALREHRSVSEMGARLIEEGLRQQRFPHIEFRSFNGQRHACIKGALQVWQLILVAKGYEMDMEKTAAHLDLKVQEVQAAIVYYHTFPREIDEALKENDLGFHGLKSILPGLQLASEPIGPKPKTA